MEQSRLLDHGLWTLHNRFHRLMNFLNRWNRSMKTWLLILTAAVVLPAMQTADTPDEFTTQKKHVVTLFDGKTFRGWTGDKSVFRIEDGAIVGGNLKSDIPHNFFLTHQREFDDFELRLKFRLKGEDTNAGIQIRSRRIPEHHEMIGYQADLGQKYWGALYDESRRRKILAGPDLKQLKRVLKTDDWNEYRIRCEGRRVRLWINGMKTVDFLEPDKSIERRGLIGLQIHGGKPGEAWYKDIRILPLKK